MFFFFKKIRLKEQAFLEYSVDRRRCRSREKASKVIGVASGKEGGKECDGEHGVDHCGLHSVKRTNW